MHSTSVSTMLLAKLMVRVSSKLMMAQLVREEKGCSWAELTNSGWPPDEPIRETGGLKDLRRIVERAGGSMTVKSAPRFLLRVEFQERGTEDWIGQRY